MEGKTKRPPWLGNAQHAVLVDDEGGTMVYYDGDLPDRWVAKIKEGKVTGHLILGPFAIPIDSKIHREDVS